MTFTLTALKRIEPGEKVRAGGEMPGVVYGAGQTSESIALNPNEFFKLYRAAGTASLIDLMIDSKPAGKVLVQAVQYHPVTDRIIHVDLRRIDLHKTMTATVELRFVGEAPIIKSSGGTLVTTVSTVEVKCLPPDLVSHLEVDVSVLAAYDQAIKIKDLSVPAGVVITKPHADDLVVKVARALTEEEIKALEEKAQPADLSTIEVVGAKPAEGEAAEPGTPEKASGAPAEAQKDEKKSAGGKGGEEKTKK